jgi:hypothetical protein
LDRIPPDGEVSLIEDGSIVPKADVRRKFQRYVPLADLSASQRGWAALTLRSVSGGCLSTLNHYGKGREQ